MTALGTKIIGDFGGYTELWNGEVVAVATLALVAALDVGPVEAEVKVKWDNGATTTIMEGEINAAVGKLSPIGYYTEEAYYNA